MLAGCLRSKAFFENMSPVICVDPQNPGKPFEDFSYPVDNLIYRMAAQYRVSTAGKPGTEVVPFQYLQITASAYAVIGDILPDQVPMVEARAQQILAQPVEGVLPVIEDLVSYWLGKSRAQKIAMRAAADPQWTPEDLVREISKSVDAAQQTKNSAYRFEVGDGHRSGKLDIKRLQSGLPEYDRRMAGGFGYREFTLGIAATGAGKTVMACQLAATFACNGFPGMLITTEQAHEELEPRLYSNFCDIPFHLIVDGVNLEKLPPDKRAAVQAFDARIKGKMDILDWNTDRSKSIVQDLQNEVVKFKDVHGYAPHWLIFDWIGGALGEMSKQDMLAIRQVYQSTADKIADIAVRENMVCIAFAQANILQAKNNIRIDSSTIAECKTLGRAATTIFGISCLQENVESMETGGAAPYTNKQYLFISKARKGVGGLIPVFRKFENQKFICIT